MSTTYVGEITIGEFLAGVTPVLQAVQAFLSVQGSADTLQINAATAALANLQLKVPDPAGYISELISGAVQAQANLSVAIPAVDLATQIQATITLIANLEVQFGAIPLQIVIDLLGLLAAGGYAFSHASTISALGGELNAVTPDTGLDPGAQIRGVTFLVSAGNSASVAALNTVFRVS